MFLLKHMWIQVANKYFIPLYLCSFLRFHTSKQSHRSHSDVEIMCKMWVYELSEVCVSWCYMHVNSPNSFLECFLCLISWHSCDWDQLIVSVVVLTPYSHLIPDLSALSAVVVMLANTKTSFPSVLFPCSMLSARQWVITVNSWERSGKGSGCMFCGIFTSVRS